MKKYYYTFGNCKKYPYQNAYLIVVASDYCDADFAFGEKYPNSKFMNYSFRYDEEEWENVGKKDFLNQHPAEIIWSKTCFGKKPEGYDDLFIFVPEMKEIVRIAEGIGDNLLPEDWDEGYVDYIYYEQYELSQDIPEVDGGQVLLKESFRDKYKCTADCIPDVLGMAYGNYFVDCRILA